MNSTIWWPPAGWEVVHNVFYFVIRQLIALFFKLADIHMASPPTSPTPSHNLQGASHITGSFAQGHAVRNNFNFADAHDLQQDLDIMLAVPGRVHLYELSDHSSINLTTQKPDWMIRVSIALTLAPVLKMVAEKYSPIKSMSGWYYLSILQSWYECPEPNIRIHAYDDDTWDVKGKFDIAVNHNEEIQWLQVGREQVLPLWLVHSQYLFI